MIIRWGAMIFSTQKGHRPNWVRGAFPTPSPCCLSLFTSPSSRLIRRLFLLAALSMISLLLFLILSGSFFLPPCCLLPLIPTSGDLNDLQHLPLTSSGRLSCTSPQGCSLPSVSHLNFLVVGDIGGLPIVPYYSYAQTKVARAMAKLSRHHPPHFVVNVGDNFYFNGVQNVFDPRFELSFEDIYAQPELLVPWFTVAGNHDHLGNISAQLDHTNFSSKWTFPNLFYKIRILFGQNSSGSPLVLEMLMLDTIVFCGNTVDMEPGQSSLLGWLFAKKCDPEGPSAEHKELAREQWEWAEGQLKQSDADYLFVVGHYPIHSVSEHGGFSCLRRLDSLLHSHRVTAYFSGHDHNLQHIQFPNKADGTEGGGRMVHYVVSGAASRTDRSSKHLDDVPQEALQFRYPTGWNPLSQIGFSNGGFVKVRLGEDGGKLSFYSGTQELKHTFEIEPRTTKNEKRGKH